MSQAAYSDLKSAWHLDKIAALRRGEQVAPSQLQLILSDLCNQDCHFCAYRMSSGFSSEQFGEAGNRNPNRKIPTAKALEILQDAKTIGVKAIQFTGGGEPTVHPDHLHIFEQAQLIGLETSLVTNGVLLRPGWQGSIPSMKWVRVSIDASSPDEYAAVRRVKPDFYHKALSNLAEIARAIQMSGSDCTLGAGYVVTQENHSDLVAGVSRIRDAGAHNVRLSAMFSTQGAAYYRDLPAIRERIERVKELQTDSFRVVDLFGDRITDLVQHAPDYEFCGYQQFNMYVGGNLKVYRCCTTAYTAHGEVGDLSNQRLSSWFYSSQKARNYNNFDARSCLTCQFNSKNRVINYLRDGEPLHVNFV